MLRKPPVTLSLIGRAPCTPAPSNFPGRIRPSPNLHCRHRPFVVTSRAALTELGREGMADMPIVSLGCFVCGRESLRRLLAFSIFGLRVASRSRRQLPDRAACVVIHARFNERRRSAYELQFQTTSRSKLALVAGTSSVRPRSRTNNGSRNSRDGFLSTKYRVPIEPGQQRTATVMGRPAVVQILELWPQRASEWLCKVECSGYFVEFDYFVVVHEQEIGEVLSAERNRSTQPFSCGVGGRPD